MSETPRRTRRSAPEAREAVMQVAEARLQRLGVAGLNIADVAREAGMSHATLLHHFGSSEDMRKALVVRMTERLADDLVALLDRLDPDVIARAGGVPPELGDFYERVFHTLCAGGHARLIAWLDVMSGDPSREAAGPAPPGGTPIRRVVDRVARRLGGDSSDPETLRRARYVILLVVSSAIGIGVSRASLGRDLDFDAREEAAYARWIGGVVKDVVVRDGMLGGALGGGMGGDG